MLLPELESTALPHIQDADRHEVLLFPPSLDEYIMEDNPVRFIDACTQRVPDQLDLPALGFKRAAPSGSRVSHPAGPTFVASNG